MLQLNLAHCLVATKDAMMVCSDTNGVSPVKVSASTGCSSETDNKNRVIVTMLPEHHKYVMTRKWPKSEPHKHSIL